MKKPTPSVKSPVPPAAFHAFFRWFCKPSVMANIEGDLLELYHERVGLRGRRKADLMFARDVLRLFRPSVIRRFKPDVVISPAMYRNHLTAAWRNLLRSKAFSAINVSGLTLGLMCSILIGLWVNDEEQINKFHEDVDRIFIVTSVEHSGNETNGSHDTPGLLGEELPKIFPEVEFATNFGWGQFHTFAVGDNKMRIMGNFANNDFFQMFSYPVIAGKKDQLLSTPESIVISRRMAALFFGSPEEALDKTIRFETYKDLKITGVFEDVGSQSSEKFDYIITWQLMVERNPWLKDWNNSGPTTFVKLRTGSDPALFAGKIRELIKGYDKNYSQMDRLELGIQPYGDMYLHSRFKGPEIVGGRIEYVNMFKLVAVFVLVIACVNFMNLSTARSVKRSKEIAIRKVVGAVRTALINQFMVEAFLFTLIAVVLALVLVVTMLPYFNALTEKNIQSPLTSILFWERTVIITLLTALISGLYPALVISSFRPAVVLKKASGAMTGSSGNIRRSLVVFQFALSMIFIIGMIVVSQQVNYIYSKNIGYAKDNLIYSPISGEIATRFNTYKSELMRQPGIQDVTKMSARPVTIGNSTGSVEWIGKDPSTRPTFTQVEVGMDFIKTMKSELLLGRDFIDAKIDSANYIINEAAMKVIGYKDPIGMPLKFWDVEGRIVGVVKDFHFASLHVSINPLVIRVAQEKMWGWTVVRTQPGKTLEAVQAMETLQEKFSPDTPFSHQFADEEYGSLYTGEKLVQILSRYFAGLAIFISCLGLLGSVVFTAEQRRREMSIRKVLGATATHVMSLLSGDFLKQLSLSAMISFPLAWYLVNDWLKGFEYRIEVGWWVFALAGASSLFIAVITVFFHAFKAATANPVSSLRSE
jgi:putative ABC transport system permease protein